MTERELIWKIEKANTAEFAEILKSLTEQEADAVRAHWGPEIFEQMRGLAQARRTRAAVKGNVVVLHGIMGGELEEVKPNGASKPLWLSILRLIGGVFGHLGMNVNGSSVNDIRATGVLKKYYGLQLLTLAQDWNTRAFWYDWRADINTVSDELSLKIKDWFPGNNVHIVAHSMGGLVARAFIQRHAAQWNAMWDPNRKTGARLVMLGTPNRGSFAIPQLLTGMNDILRLVAKADLFHNRQELVQVVKSFVGTYQMMPSPAAFPADPNIPRLYESKTYGGLNPPVDRFRKAQDFHDSLKNVVDPDRMIYVAGFNQPTYDGLRDLEKLDSPEGYTVTMRGDGTVPHKLGLLDGVPAYYVEAEHGGLPNNAKVLDAMDDLLSSGATTRLPTTLPAGVRGAPSQAALLMERRRQSQQQEDEFVARVARFRMAAQSRGGPESLPDRVQGEESQLEDMLVQPFLRAGGAKPAAPEPQAKPRTRARTGPQAPLTKLRVGVVHGGIEGAGLSKGTESADAVVVGHYLNVLPVSAEGALDKAISADGERLLRRFSVRGVIRGELGQLFMLADPRKKGRSTRTIVVAGMGSFGQFDAVSCTTLVRELYGTLGLLKKKHIATVLIGSGQGNLSVRETLSAWIEGVRQAHDTLAEQGGITYPAITFVEYDPGRVLLLYRRLQRLAQRHTGPFKLDLATRFTKPQEERLKREWAEKERRRLERDLDHGQEAAVDSETPTRLSVERTGAAYRFSAITETAAVPQREISIDADLVLEANDQLVRQYPGGRPEIERRQEEAGRYLQKLLIPEDLEPQLNTSHPLVITCDATCARIHWEMVAQPRRLNDGGGPAFLGIDRSVTRQLATVFAALPEMEGASDNPLRVLVIGDPAADAPLEGAQEEAEVVRQIFADYGSGRPVQVTSLIGPDKATRTRVMRELLVNEFDVLHYAGHCDFDENDIEASGWIFTGSKRLTTHELSRVRRMPRFVFSNACESGLTPDRSAGRNAAMGPSFAEAFFARGVRNFVCTGWPVGDTAARTFAEVFYRNLLSGKYIHQAIREARQTIQQGADGIYTWGAYQHYGDPYWRLVHPSRRRGR